MELLGIPQDPVFKAVKPVSSTFQNELQKCMDTLGLNDTLGTSIDVIGEMFISLLQCRVIDDSDSSGLNTTFLTSNIKLPEENVDSCKIRIKRNWDTIFREIHPSEGVFIKNFFWDEQNFRVYQFIWKGPRKEKPAFSIRTFRQDCIFRYIEL